MSAKDGFVYNTIEYGPNPDMLREKAAPVSFPLTEEDLGIIELMRSRLNIEERMVGLAAPQISYHKQIIFYHVPEHALRMRVDATELVPVKFLINPTYTPITDEMFYDWEGCFSVAETMGKIERSHKIRVVAQDLDGNPLDFIAEGFEARVIQHEIDHLNGKLFIDYLKEEDISGPIDEMVHLRHQEIMERSN